MASDDKLTGSNLSLFSDFPFIKNLEDNWEVIREELDNLLYNEVESNKSYFTPWHETDIYEGGWDVYGLYAFGDKLESNCKLCPKTAEIVEGIPGVVTAGFSALAPDTHIKPHVGYTKDVVRCHLGLITPAKPPSYEKTGNYWLRKDIQIETLVPVCGLRLDGFGILEWTPGRAFLFDDTVEHEAWNFGNRTRFILLLDILRSAYPRLLDS